MFDPKLLDDLSRRMAGLFPAGAKELQQDLEKNLRAALTSAFAKLDLVTREELEVQTAVLERTRAKLAALERRVAQLEQNGSGSPSPAEQGPEIQPPATADVSTPHD
jgi:BMFP domain-containing protein YqiC